MKQLDVVIVNWNSGVQLWSCLSSLASVVKSNNFINRVVVVDNASTDNSFNILDELDLPLKIIRNNENRGFAAACNQGAKGSTADYLLFLNPDTRLFQESLDKAIKYMEDPGHKDVGIIGIQLLDENGRICTEL